jgi:hypothetical protein
MLYHDSFAEFFEELFKFCNDETYIQGSGNFGTLATQLSMPYRLKKQLLAGGKRHHQNFASVRRYRVLSVMLLG